MATATKTRKRSSKRAGSRSGPNRRHAAANKKPSSNGHAKAEKQQVVKGTKDDPKQTYIEGTEPPKIPEVDTMLEQYGKKLKTANSAKQTAQELLGKIKDRLEKDKTDVYRSPFGDVTIRPSEIIVKVKLPKSQ